MTTEAPVDFALLGHPSSYDHLGDLFIHSKPDFDVRKLEKYRATLTKFFEWTPSYVSRTPLEIACTDGRRISGRLVICTFLPESLSSPRQLLAASKKTTDACELAHSLGARIVGLGGFTSIVGGAQGADLSQRFGIEMTSGNSLTAALAVAQMREVLSRLNWKLDRLTIALIGATGDIGRACTLVLAEEARRLMLVARNRAKLDELRAELPARCDVSVSTRIEDAVQAQVIVAATSAAKPLLAEDDLQPGTLVFDIGYPKNVSFTARRRADVLAISAGLAQLPFELDMMYQTQLSRPDLMYGCFSEAMLLAISGRYESFSTGQGRITPERMAEILSLAQSHGFRPAPACRGSDVLDDRILAEFVDRANSATLQRNQAC
jgi:predicted amino acid dehydrogenase